MTINKVYMRRFVSLRVTSTETLGISLFLLPLVVLFLAEVILSFQWRIQHDTPYLHYVAFMLDQTNSVLYRDVFEVNVPGIYLFHLAIWEVAGAGDLAFRIIDIFWLAALLSVTWALMRRFDTRVAWLSVILFGLSYFHHGPDIILQRDYLGLLPVALAVLLAANPSRFSIPLRFVLVGLLFGLAVSIKPHLLTGMPLVLYYGWHRIPRTGPDSTAPGPSVSTVVAICVFSAMGLLAPLLAQVLWLWVQGSIGDAVDIYSSYLPLYASVTGGHQTISGVDRIVYLVTSYIGLSNLGLWLIPASLGVFVAAFGANATSQKKQLVYLLAGLAVIYSIHPVLAGKFWSYHWLPFQYFLVIVASIGVVAVLDHRRLWSGRFISLLAVGLLFCALMLHPPREFFQQLNGSLPAPNNGRVDEIAGYLKANLGPNDTVQPLDTSGGALHAMLISRARVATSFQEDYFFYHHVSDPFIQSLRSRFVQELRQTRPRFIIDVETSRVWPSGPGTTREFHEVRELLDAQYVQAFIGEGYLIYERKPE